MTHVLSELRQNVQMFLTVKILVTAHASDRVRDFGGTFKNTFLAAASEKAFQFVKGSTGVNRTSFYTVSVSNLFAGKTFFFFFSHVPYRTLSIFVLDNRIRDVLSVYAVSARKATKRLRSLSARLSNPCRSYNRSQGSRRSPRCHGR